MGAWSLLAASILIVPCLVVLLEFHSLAATCGAIFLLVYATIMVSVMLIVLVFIGRFFVKPVLKLLFWTSVFVVWWWFVDTFFFISVGVPCGYVIANPLLCCAVVPSSCVLVSHVGVYGLLALQSSMTGGSVLWWLYSSRTGGLLALVAFGILGAGVASRGLTELSTQELPTGTFLVDGELSGNKRAAEPWKSIAAFKLTGHEAGVLEIATKLQRQFLACSESVYCLHAEQKDVAPIIDLIVGPESCVPCALNNEPSLCALFDNLGSSASPQVLLGARRQEEDILTATQETATQEAATQEAFTKSHKASGKNKKCFNSAFIMHQGRIIYCYDKQFPLPFLETRSSPSWLSFLCGLFFSKQKVSRAKNIQAEKEKNSLFLSEEKTPYSAGTGTGEVILSLGGNEYHARLALCSDFFCTTPEYSKKNFWENNPLLIVLTHDSWFYGTSVADRMHRYAVLWAIRHQIPVLYVGNHCASWIDCSGRVWPLVTVDS
jgi:hypothetical protein